MTVCYRGVGMVVDCRASSNPALDSDGGMKEVDFDSFSDHAELMVCMYLRQRCHKVRVEGIALVYKRHLYRARAGGLDRGRTWLRLVKNVRLKNREWRSVSTRHTKIALGRVMDEQWLNSR
jgi:hypothetical protein